MNKHVLTKSDKNELELQRYYALKAIDDLLRELPLLRVMVEEAPFDGFQNEATPSSMRQRKTGQRCGCVCS